MCRHKGRGVSGLVKRLLVLRNCDKLYMCFLVLQVTRYSAQKLGDMNPVKAFRRLLTKHCQVFNVHGSVHRNNILVYKPQQDAHVTEFILSDNCSTLLY